MTFQNVIIGKSLASLILAIMLVFGAVGYATNEESTYYTDAETARQVQENLNALGYECDIVDGIAGNKTNNAIIEFKEDHGLPATEKITKSFMEELECELEARSVTLDSQTSMPDGLIVDEAAWEAWKVSGSCKLYPFMSAAKQVGFTFTIPTGQGSSAHKKVQFVFEDGSELNDVEMYYCVEDQTILYLGLWTEDKTVFESEDFKEACIRLMLAYNNHFDKDTKSAVLNLTRERAEEVVDYCLNNIEHCLVDDMRIRVLQEDDYYSFHMEY